jgi:hypothetical protein
MDMQLKRAFEWFLANDNQHNNAVYALQRARAELWAKELDIEARWEWDEAPWDCDAPAPEELLACVLEHDGEFAILCSIGDPTPEYRRLIEADLAIELQHTLHEREANLVLQL